MEIQKLEEGQYLQREEDVTKSMFIVVEGWISISRVCDGNEFVFERLTRGSVLNHRNFITEELSKVNIKCLNQAKLYRLSKITFENFKYNQDTSTQKALGKKLYHFYYKPNPIVIDCINSNDPTGRLKEALGRNNILKNVVLNIILEKLQESSKPKLKDILNLSNDSQQRLQLIQRLDAYNKFKMKRKTDGTFKDIKYDYMRELLERIFRLTILQNDGMVTLDNKLNLFSQRKKKRIL